MAVLALDIPLDGVLTEEDARAIFAQGEEAVVGAWRQTCLAHLLRELEHTEKYKSPGKH